MQEVRTDLILPVDTSLGSSALSFKVAADGDSQGPGPGLLFLLWVAQGSSLRQLGGRGQDSEEGQAPKRGRVGTLPHRARLCLFPQPETELWSGWQRDSLLRRG